MQPVQSQVVYNTLASNSIADIVIVVVNPTWVRFRGKIKHNFRISKKSRNI